MLRAQTPAAPATDGQRTEQAEYDPRGDLQAAIQTYIEEWRDRHGSNEPGLIIQSGIEGVPLRPDNPDWVKSRTLTFERAVLKAQKDFVILQGSTNTADSTLSLFRAANQEPPPFRRESLEQAGALPDLTRRILAVARGRLDNELREIGVDPAELNRVPEPQRHVQLANQLRLSSVRRAFGELVGFSPIQSFEANDGQGNFYIGTVLAGSHRRKAVAQQILTRRGQFEPNPNPTSRIRLRTLVADRRALVDDFGVRLIDDENGLPVLVSFAQWGVSYQGGDRMRADLEREAAEAQVQAQADRQITEFLAASASFEGNEKAGSGQETVAQRHADGYVAQEATTSSIFDAVNQTLTRRAQINNLPGIYTLSSWSARHPETNRPIVGCVRVWSAVSETAIRDYRNPPRQAEPTTPQSPAPAGRPGIRRGREIIGGQDF